jgi:hypothetical protein
MEHTTIVDGEPVAVERKVSVPVGDRSRTGD